MEVSLLDSMLLAAWKTEKACVVLAAIPLLMTIDDLSLLVSLIH
jgi:hypothetical protein